MITLHHETAPFLAALVEPDQTSPDSDCDWVALLYRIIDVIVASFRTALNEYDEEIDAIEDEMFANPSEHLLHRLFRLKRDIVGLRRVVVPQRTSSAASPAEWRECRASPPVISISV